MKNIELCKCYCNHSFLNLQCTHVVMAHTKDEITCSSRVFMNSEVKSKASICEMCKEYEIQLQETLDELSSILMVNKLLQKELLLHTSIKPIGRINLGPNESKGSPRNNADSKWTHITAKSKKDKRQEYGVGGFQKIDNFIDTSNRYAPLTKLSDAGDTIPVIINGDCLSKKNYKLQQSAKGKSPTNKVRNSISSKCPKRKNKILILGDSHSRGIANEVQPHVGKDFIVQALVKPGANIEAILHQTDSEIANLTERDVCIIWGGTQDIAKNESNQGLQQLMKFIGKHRNTNVIFMEVPHRYDLKADSCVNEETREFNRKLKSLSEQYANLCVLEISINREVYTRHGLHMNRIGKEQTAGKIATEIGTILKGNKEKPVVQQWEQDENREKSIVGAVKVSSVSDTEVDNVDPLGITTSTPNNQEMPSRPSSTMLDLNLSNLEGLLTEGVNPVSMSSDPKKCDEIIIAVTNTNQGTKGIIETTAKEAIPILDLNQNSLEKSLLENTDVISMLSKSNKSDEESNKLATNSELETKDTIDPTVREITSKLDSNQSNTEGLLTKSTNIVSDTLALHNEPVSTRISNRKKQFPLTRNEDFLWE